MTVALLVTLVGATGVPACNGHDDHHAPTDALIQGEANIDGFDAFSAATATNDAAKAPTLTSPASDAKVPGAQPIKFEWKAATAQVAPFDRTHGFAARFPIPFASIRDARAAHGDPMNGKAYLLTLRNGETNVVRVFTTDTTYQPDAAAWQKLRDARTISATVTVASFDNNRIVSGSGPFVGNATSFTIEP
jgi:hypothetical protein